MLPLIVLPLQTPATRFCRSADRKSSGKGRQKHQKVSKTFDTFRQFSRRAKKSKIVKNIFRHFSTVFAQHQFSGPFCLECPNPVFQNPVSTLRLFGFFLCFQSMLLSAPNKDSPITLQSDRNPQPAPVAHVTWPNSIRENKRKNGTKNENTEQKTENTEKKKKTQNGKIREFRISSRTE